MCADARRAVCAWLRVCVCVRACACVRVHGRNDWAAWWMERRCAAQVYASKDLGSKESQALQALPMAVHTTPCAPHLRRDSPHICSGTCQ
jgi:hypothetical protein